MLNVSKTAVSITFKIQQNFKKPKTDTVCNTQPNASI
jgi:hypothetical protein